MTRIVTNGFWATNDRNARRRLSSLVEVGLDEINFSTGDDHAEYVPLSHVVRGAATSLEFSLGLAVMIEAGASRKVTKKALVEEEEEYPILARAIAEDLVSILESPWMDFAPDGTHVEPICRQLADATNLMFREPCSSVLSTVVVTPNEDLGMCWGLPRALRRITRSSRSRSRSGR